MIVLYRFSLIENPLCFHCSPVRTPKNTLIIDGLERIFTHQVLNSQPCSICSDEEVTHDILFSVSHIIDLELY